MKFLQRLRNKKGALETIAAVYFIALAASIAVTGHIQYKKGLWGPGGSERVERCFNLKFYEECNEHRQAVVKADFRP